MRTKQLGKTGVEFTVIGLGTWAIGGGDWLFGWGPQDENEAIAAIHRAVELGINWIDTAAVYGGGQSELLVGKALAELDSSRRPMIATKCSRIIGDDGRIRGVLKRENILVEIDESLRRLKSETIDLYQIHWPIPDEDIEEGWRTLSDLVQQGKVRHIGVSNFDVDQLQRIQPIHPIASLQPPYNMLMRQIEERTLSFCQRNGIGVIVYSPMYKGLLTGKFDVDLAKALPESDHRRRDPRFQSPQLELNLQLVDSLRSIAAKNEKSLAELAIAWVLRRTEVTAAIVGARRPEQIEQVIGAADWSLSEDDVTTIDRLLQSHETAIGELPP